MALDASWWLDDARAHLPGSIIDREMRSEPAKGRSHAWTAPFKRSARFWVRAWCALQLRWYRVVYRSLLAEVGEGSVFGSHLIVQGHDRIRVGRDVRVNDQVFLQCGGDSELIIGDDVTISIGAKVMTGQYPVDSDGHDRSTHVYDTIVIEDGAWIGAGAVVLPGVRIGRGSIVGAGSVVNRDVPPGVLVAGSPAKVIRHFGEHEMVRPETRRRPLREIAGRAA